MPPLSKLLRNLIHRQAIEQDLDQELRSYVDLVTAEKVQAGLTEQAARRAALIELGGVEQTKENVRGVKAGALLWQLWVDLSHGVRILRRNPGFAVVAIFSLALGIGVNSTAFSTVFSLVLHPFPFPHMDRIMTLWETTSKSASREAVSAANYFDWKNETRSFESMAAVRELNITMNPTTTRSGEPERIQAAQVSAGFFHLLDMAPPAGRTFFDNEGFDNEGFDNEGFDNETQPGRDGVVVVSFSFWKTRLASAPDAIGRTLVLGPRTYSIVGVMPESFSYPAETDVWLPLALTPSDRNDRTTHDLMVLGRLKPGVTPVAASDEVQAIAGRLQARYPGTNNSRGARLISLVDEADPMTTRFVLVLLCAAQFVLLLAGANVANLLLAQATARQKEIAIRSALGGGRARIARQLLAEVAVVGILAGCLGVALGAWNLEHFRAAVPPQIYRYVPGIKMMRMDRASALLSIALSIAGALVCSLPALYQLLGRRASTNPGETLKEFGRVSGIGSPRSRLRSIIVIAESALALLLLVGAGLMVQTFRTLLSFDKGFDPSNLMTMQVALPESRYQTPEQTRTFYARVLGGLSNLPDASRAAASSSLPPRTIRVEGRPRPLPGEPQVEMSSVSPGYFETMKIPLRQGRHFTDSDSPDSQPVVIVSQSVVNRNWPQTSPLGRSIQFDGDPAWYTVVGVCGDLKEWFTREPQPAAYRPFAQSPQRHASLLLRTPGNPLNLADSARRQVYQVDPAQPVFNLDSMENVIAQVTSGVGAAANMMTIYGLIALLLAPAGIYSLSSYLMAQRTHEIGIRIALGAGRESILKLSLLQSGRLAGAGLAIGLVAAILLGRWMSSVLDSIVLLDWTTFAGVTLLLAACAFVAGYVPAHRAARIDPMEALRHE
jgi:putative ABC transport system permease protein